MKLGVEKPLAEKAQGQEREREREYCTGQSTRRPARMDSAKGPSLPHSLPPPTLDQASGALRSTNTRARRGVVNNPNRAASPTAMTTADRQTDMPAITATARARAAPSWPVLSPIIPSRIVGGRRSEKNCIVSMNRQFISFLPARLPSIARSAEFHFTQC